MNWKLLTTIVVILAVTSIIAIAAPTGPENLGIGTSERGALENEAAKQVNAMAGNITELEINATAITKSWQGYFGNISGKITLDDASNWTMYDWSYANPQGRIYASRAASVTWANIDCMRFEGDGALYPNLTTEQVEYIGGALSDSDSIDKTFKYADHAELTIGNVVIPASTCNSTYMYVNDTTQTSTFKEVLLTDNVSNNSVVYTAILESNLIGFNNRSMDFQMIVGENGHGNSVATQYNFWVELI